MCGCSGACRNVVPHSAKVALAEGQVGQLTRELQVWAGLRLDGPESLRGEQRGGGLRWHAYRQYKSRLDQGEAAPDYNRALTSVKGLGYSGMGMGGTKAGWTKVRVALQGEGALTGSKADQKQLTGASHPAMAAAIAATVALQAY